MAIVSSLLERNKKRDNKTKRETGRGVLRKQDQKEGGCGLLKMHGKEKSNQ